MYKFPAFLFVLLCFHFIFLPLPDFWQFNFCHLLLSYSFFSFVSCPVQVNALIIILALIPRCKRIFASNWCRKGRLFSHIDRQSCLIFCIHKHTCKGEKCHPLGTVFIRINVHFSICIGNLKITNQIGFNKRAKKKLDKNIINMYPNLSTALQIIP